MLNVKIADALFKLTELTNFDDIAEITSLKTVKNRKAAFQIVVMSDTDSVIRTDGGMYLRQECGGKEYRISITSPYKTAVFPEGRLLYEYGTACDVLLKEKHIDLTAGVPAAIWVEADITDASESGEFGVAVYESCMFGDEKLYTEKSVSAEVIGVTLPDAGEFSYYLDLWQHNSCIARAHEVPVYGEEHFRIIEEYVKTLAYLGQKAVTVIACEFPWAGQLCYKVPERANLYEYSMIKVVKHKNGRFSYDYSVMQRYIDLCFRYGINSEISVYGLANVWNGDKEHGFVRPAARYPDSVRVRYFDEQSGTYKFMHKSSEIDSYVKAIHRYFVRKKLIDIVRVSADEPGNEEAFRETIERLGKNGPQFRFKTAINHASFVQRFRDTISDFVPFIQGVTENIELLHTLQGNPENRFLWYVCCSPAHPNTYLKSESCEALFLAVFTSFIGFDGFLRWSYTAYTDDCRHDTRFYGFPVGDMNIVYPAKDGTPLLSLRYKSLRYSSELFELFTMAKKKATPEEMAEVYSAVMKTADIKEYFNEEGVVAKEKILSTDIADYTRMCDMLVKIINK